jgi:hypothetical protein
MCSLDELPDAIHYKRDANLKFLQFCSSIQPIVTTYKNRNGQRRMIQPDGISTNGPYTEMALRDHRSHTSVASYYKIKHKITLLYPRLQCILYSVGHTKYGDKHVELFPIELLEIDLEI